MKTITILGTGLIGASVGLALRANGFEGTILGWDKDPAELGIALSRGAIGEAVEDPVASAASSDVVLLAGPVFSILDWTDQLGPILSSHQFVTDVGSVKAAVCERATLSFGGPNQAAFLPGHPMAGKEVHGAQHAEAALFHGAVWLFTPLADTSPNELEVEWRDWVKKFGCRTLDLDAGRHDELCAWVSHLPQFVSTAMSALLEDRFADDEELRAEMRMIGGRALREMTRLGASPYSMWRDVAHTNTEAIAETLLALEQRLTHLREHLKTPELREEFDLANRFREGRQQRS